MSLVTRIITNTGAPLYRPNGDIASDVRITFELVNPSGMTVDAWDAETGKRVGSKSVAVTTDAGGEFSVALWPNSRGSEPTKYLCTVHSSGYRPFSGVIEDVPQPLPWAAFMAHGTPLTPQELSQLGQYLDEIEQAKDAAEAAAAGATGAVGAALDAHIAAADPHSQYAKDTDLDAHTGDTDNPHGVTPAQIGADPAGAAAGAVSAHEGAPDPHPQYATAGELGAALDGKVDKVVGMGLSAEDYSAADKIKLSGIEVGAQVNVVTSVAGKTGAVALAKADVGLSNADNTSDADKPVSTATATALSGKVDASDPRLSDAREWTAATVDQAEAEAGTATTRRAWTAQRVRQAMLGWWGGFADKATPVDADSIIIADSAASNAPKRLSWANAVAKLRGTFVEGPASAVDGQVMVFDGATGKKAKSAGYAPSEVLISRQTKTGNTVINVTAVDFANNSFYAAAHGLTTKNVIAWRMKNPPGITGTAAEKELWKFFLLKYTCGYIKVIDADNFQVCSDSAATAVIPLMNESTYDLSRVHFEKVNSSTFAAFDASGFKKIGISVFGAGNIGNYLVFGANYSTIQGLRMAPVTVIDYLFTYDDANKALAASREYTLYVHQDGISHSAIVSGMCLNSSGQIVMRNNLVSTIAFIPIDPSVAISNIKFDTQYLCNGAELIVTGTK